MGFFKTPEEKAAIEARKARERYLRSPIGKATNAHEQGMNLLQISLPVNDEGSKALSDIERIGWRLETAGYAYETNLNSMSNSQEQISSISSSGDLIGVYVFRRV